MSDIKRGRLMQLDGDQNVSQRLGMSRLGLIKTGTSKPGPHGGKTPIKLDHFIADGKYASLFSGAYPGQVNVIQVLFPSHEDELVCLQELEYWAGDRKAGYGNGWEYNLWSAKQKGYVRFEAHPNDAEAQETLRKWEATWGKGLRLKERLTLRFILPKIHGMLGYWQLATSGSKSSIPNIIGVFDSVRAQCADAPELFCRIPFDLSLTIEKGKSPGEPTSFSVLNLFPNLTTNSLETLRDYYMTGGKLSARLATEDTVRHLAGTGALELLAAPETERTYTDYQENP